MSTERDGSPVEYGVGGDRPLDGIAATVVLARDGEHGLEILLLERPRDRGSFAGAWVFPGGVVEPADRAAAGDEPDDSVAVRLAGARETFEETGLIIDSADLVHVSTWHPPQHTGRRYLTTFFVAEAPGDNVVPSPDEVADYQWIRPADALALHAQKRLLLFPPTWVTLNSFTADATVGAALERVGSAEPAHFATRFTTDMSMLMFEGDVAYDDESLVNAEGARHRIDVGARPWVYLRNPGSTARAGA